MSEGLRDGGFGKEGTHWPTMGTRAGVERGICTYGRKRPIAKMGGGGSM